MLNREEEYLGNEEQERSLVINNNMPARAGWSGAKDFEPYNYPQRFHLDNRGGTIHYRNSGDEIPEYVESNATEAGLIDENGHLQMDDLFGVQTIVIYPQVKDSLENYAKDPSKTVWTMSRDNLASTRHNTRTNNRANATDDDLTGDLSKAVFLEARLLYTNNDSPVDVGFKVTGLEPRGFTDRDRYSWVMPAKSKYQKVDESIFEPNNFFTKHMYKNYEKVNLTSLKNQIDFEKGSPNHALVDTQGFVWDIIMRNADNLQHWNTVADYLHDLDETATERYVQIPLEIAEEVHASVKEQKDRIEASFVDMNKLRVSFHRTDGEEWSQCAGLVGDAIAYGEQSKQTMTSHALHSTSSISCAIELKYIQSE